MPTGNIPEASEVETPLYSVHFRWCPHYRVLYIHQILQSIGMSVCWHTNSYMDLSAVIVSTGCQHGSVDITHYSHLVLLLSDVAGVVSIVQGPTVVHHCKQ